jgi:exonuclease SbcD
MKFVHCADLHLGRQQFSLPQRWEDFMLSFSHIVDFCINDQADFLLISGDLFHERTINAATLYQTCAILQKLQDAEIPVFAIEGNHDKALYTDGKSWMQYLNDMHYLHLLKPRFEQNDPVLSPYDGQSGCIAECGAIRIIGLGYLGASTKERLSQISAALPEADKPTVLLLHAAVDKLLGQDLAGVGRSTFDAFIGKAHYIALGHIHSRQETDGFLFNPGAPESVHLDEGGYEKGFYCVDYTAQGFVPRFIPSLRRKILLVEVDVSGCRQAQQVSERAVSLLLAQKEELSQAIVGILFHGESNAPLGLDMTELCEQVKQQFQCLHVYAINNAADVQGGQPHELSRENLEFAVIEEMLQ